MLFHNTYCLCVHVDCGECERIHTVSDDSAGGILRGLHLLDLWYQGCLVENCPVLVDPFNRVGERSFYLFKPFIRHQT